MIDGFIRASNGNWRPASVGGGNNFVHVENENLAAKLRPVQTPLWAPQMWLSDEAKPTPPWSLRSLENLECFSVNAMEVGLFNIPGAQVKSILSFNNFNT